MADHVPVNFELVFFLLENTNDLLLFFTLLDRTRSGFFGAILLVPPASTWSRLRHCEIPGQVPLRTRDSPAGRAGLSPVLQKKVYDANRCMEIAVWFADQSLLCVARPVALLFIFPEDFGGHHRDGPASPWALQELRQLQSVSDARRGAAFLCRLAESEYRRPLGFLSNMDTFAANSMMGRPHCLSRKNRLFTTAPCPRDASATRTTKPSKVCRQRMISFLLPRHRWAFFFLGTGIAVHCRFHRSKFP